MDIKKSKSQSQHRLIGFKIGIQLSESRFKPKKLKQKLITEFLNFKHSIEPKPRVLLYKTFYKEKNLKQKLITEFYFKY